jgi:hypothetical protein
VSDGLETNQVLNRCELEMLTTTSWIPISPGNYCKLYWLEKWVLIENVKTKDLWKYVSTMYDTVPHFCEMVFLPCVKRCVTLLCNGVSYFTQIFIYFKAQLVLREILRILSTQCMCVCVCVCMNVCMYVICLPILTTNSDCFHIYLSVISVRYEMDHYK